MEPDLASTAPLLATPRGPMPGLVNSRSKLMGVTELLARGNGPVAADAERASGHRYGQATYLIQLRRAGAGTALIDTVAVPDLEMVQHAVGYAEFVIHASTQDLPGLREHGLTPAKLFDTELAARLLGHPRVALGTLTAELLGYRLAKQHSAGDWSRRPLPNSWLAYAALDVELLLELRDTLAAQLEHAGKAEWARQEFEHILAMAPPPAAREPWRRTQGAGRFRQPRQLAVIRELWLARDRVARVKDIAPSRLLPDTAIIAAAEAMPRHLGQLLRMREFADPGARRRGATWQRAIDAALALPERDLPAARGPGRDGPPKPHDWPRRDPAAAARLEAAKPVMAELAERHLLPVENLLAPEALRRVLWKPPRRITPGSMADALATQQARPWQVELTARPLAVALKPLRGG